MRTVLQRVLLVSLLTLALPAVLAAAGKSFEVVARDKDGKPKAGITLSVLSGGNKFSAGVTDAKGQGKLPLAFGEIQPGANVQVTMRRCRRQDGTVTWELLAAPAGAQLPPKDNNCDDLPAGLIPWPGDGAVLSVNNVDTDTPTVAVGTGAPAMMDRADVFVGYSYFRGIATQKNFNGGEASFVYNFAPHIGIIADVAGYEAGQSTFIPYLFGAQVESSHRWWTLFGDAEFGAAHASSQVTEVVVVGRGGSMPMTEMQTVTVSSTAFAMALGGGLDVNVTPIVAIRVAQVDYVLSRFGNQTQNDVRYSAGVVFRIH